MVLRGGRRYDRAIGTYSNSPLPRRDRHRVRRHLDPTVAPIPEIILAGRGHLRIRGFGVGPAATGPDRCRADQRPGGALRARAGAAARSQRHPRGLPPHRHDRPAGRPGRRQRQGRLLRRRPRRVPPQRLSFCDAAAAGGAASYLTRGRSSTQWQSKARVAFDANGYLEYCS